MLEGLWGEGDGRWTATGRELAAGIARGTGAGRGSGNSGTRGDGAWSEAAAAAGQAENIAGHLVLPFGEIGAPKDASCCACCSCEGPAAGEERSALAANRACLHIAYSVLSWWEALCTKAICSTAGSVAIFCKRSALATASLRGMYASPSKRIWSRGAERCCSDRA